MHARFTRASRGVVRGVAFTAVVLGLCVASSPARAEAPLPIDLQWNAPSGCPTRDAVLDRVRAMVDELPEAGPPIEARARIARQRGALELEIVVREGDVEDRRTARAQTCASLAEAAAIILAAALDPTRRAPPAAAAPVEGGDDAASRSVVQGPPEEPPTRGGVASRAPSPVTARQVPRVRFGAGVATSFDFGTLPRPASSIEAIAHVELDHWRFGLSGSSWRAQQHAFMSNGGARFDVVGAGAFACGALGSGRLRLGGCAEVDVAHMKVEGYAIESPGLSRVVFPTLRAGILGETRVGAVVVFARADAAFAIGVPRLVLSTGVGSVGLHEVGVPALRLTFGARVDLL